MISVYKSYLPEGSLRYAHDALDSGWLSQGPYLEMAREMLSAIWETEWVILTNSGTAANHMMARAMKVKYPERQNLVVPNNTYVAAWNPFLEEGFRLVPQDANIDTWNADLGDRTHHINRIEFQLHRTNLILAVHNLGNIVNVPALQKRFPDTVIIEDNCEGFGGAYEGRPSGTASECFSMSFYGNKNLTTGEGGAFVTYDEEVYHYAHAVHGQGQSSKKFIHNIYGYNYRMTNVEAAILVGQLEIRNEIFERKAAVFDYYKGRLKELGVEFQMAEEGTHPSNWMFAIRIPGNLNYERARDFFFEEGIETRPMFYPISYHLHLHPRTNDRVSKHCDEIATQLAREVVVLPSFPEITTVQQDYITDKVGEYVRKFLLL